MNNDEEHKTECYGTMTIKVPDGYVSEYTSEAFEGGTYDLDYIRGRGNSTWMTTKKPYKIKLDKKQDFFGMGKNKHWVLLANYYDYSLIRNKYTYYLGEKMGLEYTPQCVFVDVVMNGEYLGSYYLCEHVRVGSGRIDIDDLEDEKDATELPAISGGYLLSMGYESGQNRMIETARGQGFLLENPDFSDSSYEGKDEAVNAQYDYISDYVQKTEDAIFGDDFKDESGVSYTEYLDVDSAIDYYMVQEFSMNGDGFASNSTYLYKKRDGKLYFGPLWDFDYVAWGATEFNGNDVEGFYHNTQLWYERLFEDPSFKAKFIARWKEVKELLSDTAKDGGIIDQYAKQLYFSQKVNYQLADTLYTEDYYDYWGWDDIGSAQDLGEDGVTFISEIQRLKDWVNERILWFDDNIENIDTQGLYGASTITFMVDGEKYYTLNLYYGGYFDRDFIPNNPSKEGYVFDGWYVEGTDESINDIGDYLDESITVYAKWIEGDAKSLISGISFPADEFLAEGVDSEGWTSSVSIPVSVMPFYLGGETLEWSVDDPSIAEVEGGVITPLADSGDVTVTASLGGYTDSCVIHIVSADTYYVFNPDSIRKKLPDIKVAEGGYANINFFKDDEAYPIYMWQNLSFYSSDETIAKVDDYGCVYGTGEGKAVAVATSMGDMRFVNIDVEKGRENTPDKGTISKGYTFTKGGLKYIVTKVGGTSLASVKGASKNNVKKIKIPGKVSYKGFSFKVAGISKNAFKGNKKLTGITIKSTFIKTIGKNAFKGISKKAVIKCPGKKLKKYRKLIKKSGISGKVSIK